MYEPKDILEDFYQRQDQEKIIEFLKTEKQWAKPCRRDDKILEQIKQVYAEKFIEEYNSFLGVASAAGLVYNLSLVHGLARYLPIPTLSRY